MNLPRFGRSLYNPYIKQWYIIVITAHKQGFLLMNLFQIISTSWQHTRANRFKEYGSTFFYRNENEKALHMLNKAL
ncbi:MAG: hypothetical protein ABI700_30220, partial [Chloroflexota bacterium]